MLKLCFFQKLTTIFSVKHPDATDKNCTFAALILES